MTPPAPVRARLATAQGDPEIGAERIVVYHDDGHREEVVLHDYRRLYALPGLYEQIVQEDLGCRSPGKVAQLLGDALDALHREDPSAWPGRGAARVIDIAAGNGVSGEALRDAGIPVVLGTDLVPEARVATLRDRPGVYDEYLTLDLTALTDEQRAHLRGLNATALTCVAPVTARAGSVPPAALGATAALLADDALVVALHDPRHGEPDPVSDAFWRAQLGPGIIPTRLHHERYLHRFRVTGAPYELEASVWRLRASPGR